MKRKYLPAIFFVASAFAYFELSKIDLLKKPPKSDKKLVIIDFKRPEYNFSSTIKEKPPAQATPRKRARVKSAVIKEINFVKLPLIESVEKKPKQIKEPCIELKEEIVPQKMVQATVGDDVEGQLSEIKNMRQALLRSEKTPLFLKESIMALESLREDYGVELGFAYRSVVQSDFVSKEAASGGNMDIIAMYKPNQSSTFAINLNSAHKTGKYSSSTFAKEIGSLYTTSPSYSSKDLEVSELWYQYQLDELTLRAGVVDAGSLVDSSYFMSSNNFFFNSSIVSTPYADVPSNGLGLSLNYKIDEFYISSQLSDADANSRESIGSSVDRAVKKSLSLYSAFEFGVRDKESLYYVNFWHKEQDKNAKGLIVSLNQSLDETHKIFAKAAISKGASAKEYLSLGWGRDALFFKEDKVGVAYSLAKSEKSEDIQNNFEIFYRYDYLYGIQLSANIELLNPIYSKEDLAVLGGLRLRLVF